MASKQPKNGPQGSNIEQLDVPLIAVAAADQAPVIPEFTPYVPNTEYEPPYSASLLAKSNDLARACFKDQVGYDAFTKNMKWSLDESGSSNEVVAKNYAVFPHSQIDNMLSRMTTIRVGPYTERWGVGPKLQEAIKKLRRLEKTHADEDILDADARERIINTVLLPAQQFGLTDYTTNRPGLRFPMQKIVATEMLSEDDIDVIDSIVSFIPMIRERFQFYKPWTQGATKEELLEPLLVKKMLHDSPFNVQQYAWTSPEEDATLIKRLKQMKSFFSGAIPSNVQYDYIPETRWPQRGTQAQQKMVHASQKVRDISAGYIAETKRLSELLEAIVDLSNEMLLWLQAETNDLGAYFRYLNRIGLSYEQLVEESKERIHDQDAPW